MHSLARAYLAHRTIGPRDDLDRTEARLDALLAIARTQHPYVTLAPEAFAAALGAHSGDDGVDTLSETFAVADLYLATACVHRDPIAQASVHEMMRALAPVHVARFDRSPGFANEIAQELTTRLLFTDGDGVPRIASYTGRGSLGAFLRVSLIRLAQDALRRAQKHGELPQERAATEPSPEIEVQKDQYAAAFKVVLQRVLGSLEPTERAMLKDHYLGGRTLEQLAAQHQISRATLARRLAEVKRRIVEETLAVMQVGASPGSNGPGAMLALIESRLDLSLSRHLR